MEIKLLKSFVTVANTKSFSMAAQLLNYAQSSISEQIKKLETQLDTVLFERLGNNIRLTKDGEIFLSYAERILNLCDEAVSNLSSSKSDVVKGELRIAITETLCLYRFPKLLKDYHTLYPGVDIKIKMGNCYDFPIWLKKNMIDIAFALDDIDDYPDIVTDNLFVEPLVLVVNKNHAFADKENISSRYLENENLILTQKGSQYRAIFEDYLRSKNVTPKSLLEFESTEAIKNFVINNLGISFLPISAVQREIESGELLTLRIDNKDFSIPAQVLYHDNKWLSPALKSLIELTRKLTKDY